MGEITQLLEEVAARGDGALDQIFSRLHGELKALARSRLSRTPGQTLTPTGLVNELYVKFAEAERLNLESRKHFFVCAASAMRQIVVDAARARNAEKRGGDVFFVTLTEPADAEIDTDVLALDEALGDLEQIDPQLRELVELRLFAGLTIEEVSELKSRSQRSVYREWARARAFLHARMRD